MEKAAPVLPRSKFLSLALSSSFPSPSTLAIFPPQGGMFGPYYYPSTVVVSPDAGAITKQMSGGDAASLAAGGFTDGDEVVFTVNTVNDG
jgi:hypothetical protein